MSSKYKAPDSLEPYFLTSTVVRWIDALSRPLYKDILVDSLRHCIEHKGLQLHAWIIMSNHFHLIASAAPGCKLGFILRDLKKHTSKKIVAAIQNNRSESRDWMLRYFEWAGERNAANTHYQFWQEGYHPILLDTKEKRWQRLDYTHYNSVRAGLVWEPQQYVYGSAVDYFTKQPGMLPLLRLDDYTFM